METTTKSAVAPASGDAAPVVTPTKRGRPPKRRDLAAIKPAIAATTTTITTIDESATTVSSSSSTTTATITTEAIVAAAPEAIPAPTPATPKRGAKRGAATAAAAAITSAATAAETDDAEAAPAPKRARKGAKGKEAAQEDSESTVAAEAGASTASDGADSAAAFTNTSMPTEYKFDPVEPGHIKIVSYNVASLAASLKKGFLQYAKAENADIVCLQETKHRPDALPQNLLADVKQETWSAPDAKKGYSGTAVLSKIAPIAVTRGIGHSEHDDEGRVITYEFNNFYLVASYIPNAGQKLDRLPYRVKWDAAFLDYIKGLDAKKPVIWTGDLNVAHEEIDLARPKDNKKSAGFTKEEREGFSKLLASGFVDTFRHFNPGKPGQYTYWGMRSHGREKGIGWRLDYFVVSERFLPRVKASLIRAEAYGASDHVPIVLVVEDKPV